MKIRIITAAMTPVTTVIIPFRNSFESGLNIHKDEIAIKSREIPKTSVNQ